MAEILHTARLTLVPLTKDDGEAFHAVQSDPVATQWSLHGCSTTLAASAELMSGVLRTPEHDARRSWAVYRTGALDAEQIVGITTLLPKDRAGPEGTGWEIGYTYRPEYWGKGYATEACSTAIESLRDGLDPTASMGGKPKVVAWVDPENVRSVKVLQKLGFRTVEHKKFGGPDRFLGGAWREDGVLILEKEL